ncbi:hypothetical protein J3E73DRAFT_434043 [Bipolaris maydis]|nr:hypothetical protein J3E73DRAFT_434043 [Bipolaris maydis]
MTAIHTGYTDISSRTKPYCHRCDRTFDTGRARDQHYDASARHHICDVCRFDGSSYDESVQHNRSTLHRIMCDGCDDDGWWILDSQAYKDHLRNDNVCTTCERHFDSLNNLRHHKLVHLKPSVECYGCTRSFTTYSGMIIHLESGTCASSIDILDLNKSAAMCYQWQKFLDEEYRDDILSCYDLEEEYDGAVYPFKCLECDTTFSKLSGLFQHVGSGSCEQRLNGGPIAKLVKWLSNRHA